MRRRPRGAGTIVKKGSTFGIRYGPRDASTYEGGFRTRLEAEQRLTLVRAEAMQRRLGAAADHRKTPVLSVLAKPWLDRREATHAAGLEDASRWRKHLAPEFGHLRPDEVDTARLRAFVEGRRGIIAKGTVRVVVAVLSSLYEDLLERGLVASNPCRRLPKSLLRQMRSDHDPKDTPFLERADDVRRLYLALPEPMNVALAIAALAGLRTGEVLALRWSSVDLDGGHILVSESVKGQTKDRETRVVPLQDALAPILRAWKLKSGGAGLVIPPMRSDGEHVDKATPAGHVRAALAQLGLPPLEPKPFYQAGRHTFASHWVMGGGDIRELQRILGHASITDTERYAHLAPGHWSPGARQVVKVDLSPAGGRSVAHPAHTQPKRARLSIRKR